MKTLVALLVLSMFVASPTLATVAPLNLDPDGTAGTTDSMSHGFASPGFSIAAASYTAEWQLQTPLGIYFKNHGVGPAMDIIRPAGLQWRENGHFSVQLVQFEVSSLLVQGFTAGKRQPGNVQSSPNDVFAIWNAWTASDSGGQTGAISDSSSDIAFANGANFSNGKFASISALSGPPAPVAFQATLAPVPEMSALFPIIGLIAAVTLTQILRRRRMAQLRTPSPDHALGKI